MFLIKKVLKNLEYSFKHDGKDIIVKLVNNSGEHYDMVIRPASFDIYKVILTDFVKHDIKNFHLTLHHLNKHIPMGHFYFDPESREIRFLFNLFIGDDIEAYDYINYFFKYATIIYGEYYMTNMEVNKMTSREIEADTKDIKIKYFLQDIKCIEKRINIDTPYSIKTFITILNSLNMKTNWSEAIYRDDHIIVRATLCHNSGFIDECLEHIDDYIDKIKGILY